MKIKVEKISRLLPVFAFALLFLFNSCGYSVFRHSSLPFTEIAISHIENKTLEPKLQDKLHKALTEEFLRQGISVNPSAGHKLAGVIREFGMVSLSEKKGITIEYRVDVKADFSLFSGEGKKIEIKNISSPFIVSFVGSEDFGTLLANRDVAEEKALKEVAIQIVSELIYK